MLRPNAFRIVRKQDSLWVRFLYEPSGLRTWRLEPLLQVEDGEMSATDHSYKPADCATRTAKYKSKYGSAPVLYIMSRGSPGLTYMSVNHSEQFNEDVY